MRNLLIYLILLTSTTIYAVGVMWDYQNPLSEDGKNGGYYLRLPRGQKEVKAVLYCHQNMTEEVLFRSQKFCHWMDSLGVAMAFVQHGSQNWDVSVKLSPSATRHRLPSLGTLPLGILSALSASSHFMVMPHAPTSVAMALPMWNGVERETSTVFLV